MVFLCLSVANALNSFVQPAIDDDIRPVSNPFNLTTLSGTVSISEQILDNIESLILLGGCWCDQTRLFRLSQGLSSSPSLHQSQEESQDVLCGLRNRL